MTRPAARSRSPRAFVALSLCLFAACVAPRRHERAGDAATVTVLTYNIHHGEGTDGRFDLERVAGVITGAGADLVALQEVDVATSRASGVDQAGELARRTGMQHVFGEAIPYAGGSYGDAVLTRLPIRERFVWPLPAAPEHEARVAVGVVVELPDGALLRFVGTHLDHTRDPRDRVAQTRALLRRLDQHDGRELPTLLLGDLNAGPDSEPLRLLGARFASAAPGGVASFPSRAPERAIDWVLMAPPARWRARDVAALRAPVASDHAPVRAVLELLPEDGRR